MNRQKSQFTGAHKRIYSGYCSNTPDNWEFTIMQALQMFWEFKRHNEPQRLKRKKKFTLSLV